MIFILPAVFAAVLLFDFRAREGREKTIYITLAFAAVALAFIAGSAAESDHVGASLSGMISIFMR